MADRDFIFNMVTVQPCGNDCTIVSIERMPDMK